eukprot:GHRR01021066.1.p1 GENE.GHRR01021066.1~~GHRR01021066.1.p1  ORF type:complete len:156 (-),score=10.11 GHRR01021066.1:156-623(-)
MPPVPLLKLLPLGNQRALHLCCVLSLSANRPLTRHLHCGIAAELHQLAAGAAANESHTFMMSSLFAFTISSNFFTYPSVIFCMLSSRDFLVSLGKSYLSSLFNTSFLTLRTATLPSSPIFDTNFMPCHQRACTSSLTPQPVQWLGVAPLNEAGVG